MKNRTRFLIILLGATVSLFPAVAANKRGFHLDVLVNGRSRREYRRRGRTYVEALKGREYVLRIHNPLSRRVAVALSVDGLNTISAKRSNARKASKWVLEPYQTITIKGWQVNGREARRFYFTGEKGSYGAWLGQTDNLGMIEAVFYAEKRCRRPPPVPCTPMERNSGLGGRSREKAAPPSARKAQGAQAESSASGDLSNDYAATGIGRKTHHRVERIHMDLENSPIARVSIRYEFRPQLIKLGLLSPPKPRYVPSPLRRRESATGFEQAWCPDPYNR